MSCGLGGNDTIYGDMGDDTIRGNQGADTIYTGEGGDTVLGTNIEDKVIRVYQGQIYSDLLPPCFPHSTFQESKFLSHD